MSNRTYWDGTPPAERPPASPGTSRTSHEYHNYEALAAEIETLRSRVEEQDKELKNLRRSHEELRANAHRMGIGGRQ